MPYIDFSFGNIDNKLHATIKNGLFAILEKRFCFKYDCKCEQKNCIVKYFLNNLQSSILYFHLNKYHHITRHNQNCGYDS